MQDLVNKVLDWAEEKGIMSKATPASQYQKTVEEVGELGRALIELDKEQIQDAIGDIIVTLIIQAKMNNLTVEECLSGVYDIISKRKGSMINGVFVKE